MALYGLLVGISCIAALLLASSVYSYSALYGKISNTAYSYVTIVKLEAFQTALSKYQNVSQPVLQAAEVDRLAISGSGGAFVIRSNENARLYAIIN